MRLLLLLGALLLAAPVSAQISITGAPAASAPTQDFTGFTGAGFAPMPAAGQLDSDDFIVRGLSDAPTMEFGETRTTGDFARGASPGGVATGGAYAFNTGAPFGVGLGIQPSGADFDPIGVLAVRYVNNTGATIRSVTVSYTLRVLNNEGRSNAIDLWVGTSAGATYSDLVANARPVSTLDYASPQAADPAPAAWTTASRSVVLDGLAVGPGEYLMLQFVGFANGGTNNRDEFAFDDIALSASTAAPPAAAFSTTIGAPPADVAGWRMLAPPVAGLTVADLATQNLVQGVAGSFPAEGANLFLRYNGDGTSAGFVNPAGVSTATGLPVGQGFLWYFYDLTNPEGSVALPAPLALSGPARVGDVRLELPANADRLYLLGNPYNAPFALSGLAEYRPTLLSDAFNVWNPATASYDVLSAVSGDDVGAGTGFFAELLAPASNTPWFTFDADASALPRAGAPRRAQFTLAGTTASGAATFDASYLMFVEGGTDGLDQFDGSKIGSLSPTAALVSFVGEREGAAHFRAQESRPFAPAAAVSMPVALKVSEAGTYTLAWPGLDALPPTWAATLRDTETGTTTDLRAAPGVTFAASAGDWAERFVLTVTPDGLVAADDAPQAAVRVSAPVPNPAAAEARLTVSVDAAQDVSVRVYDALGRQVAVAFAGPLAADAPATVRVPTAGLAPGVYVVRVEGATVAATRRLTVVR